MTAPLAAAGRAALERLRAAARAAARGRPASAVRRRERGRVVRAGDGVAIVEGLAGVGLDDLVVFEDGTLGQVLGLWGRAAAAHAVGGPSSGGAEVVLLGGADGVRLGGAVEAVFGQASVPVGEGLLGRVIDPFGRPLDGGAPLPIGRRLPLERPSRPIVERALVRRPLHTGIKVVDALLPIGRGQRELIVGDRVTGKTALALDAILAQRPGDVVSVYVAIAKRPAAIDQALAALERGGARGRTVVVATRASDPPGLIRAAPFAGASIAEAFAEDGRDALVVYDDLTRHARSVRQLALLLRRPPGREAYPGDIFHLHSRLLERATQLGADLGGGSVTALPIAETQGGDLATYIPTNLISITDGQLVTSTRLFDAGQRPAVDVGLSVSRVGGKAQPRSLRALAGALRLAYAQFEELELFTRFGGRVDPATQEKLAAGRRVRAALVQPEGEPRSLTVEVALFQALGAGLCDRVAPSALAGVEAALAERLAARGWEIGEADAELGEPERARLLELARALLEEGGAAPPARP